MPVTRRLAVSLSAIRRRLSRRPASATTLWTPGLIRLAIGFLVAIPAAGLFDRIATEYVRASDGSVIGWLHAITDIGRSHWYLLPALAMVLGLGLYDWSRMTDRGRAGLALLLAHAWFVFWAVALPGLAVNMLKVVFGRVRPAGFEQSGAWTFEPFTAGYLNASFPSGHSTTVGAVTAILILWFPRWWAFIALAGLVLAGSRVAAHAHYPSDVAAGFGFGLVSAILLARWFAARRIGFRLAGERDLPVVAGHLRMLRKR